MVDAGPITVAARVLGADPDDVWLSVDGQRVPGPRVDPDGDLTALDGWEVTLTPGVHELAVHAADQGILRQWDVVASGMRIASTDQDIQGLVARFDRSSSRPSPRRVIIVNTEQPDVATVAGPLAATLDALIVPLTGDVIPPEGWETIDTAPGEVVLLGGPTVISDQVESQLNEVGHATVRVAGATAQSASVAAVELIRDLRPQPDLKRPLIVAPSSPFAAALRGAVAAVNLDTALVLIADQTLDDKAQEVIAAHHTLLLSEDLSPAGRAAVTAAMAPTAVASDDDLQPAAAQEAVLVADTADRARAVITAAASHPDRPVLLGSAVGTDWVAAARPGRITIVEPEAPDIELQHTGDGSLPALATMPAIDADATALVLPTPLITPGEGTLTQDPRALVTQLRQAWVDGADRPRLDALVNPTEPLTVTLSTSAPIQQAAVHVSALGYEWPGSVTVADGRATWTSTGQPTLPLPLQTGGPAAPTPIEITTTITAAAAVVHQRFDTVVGLDPGDTVSAEGWIVAGGSDPPVGDGPPQTYSVEIEPQTGLDIDAVEEEVTAILSDPRSWTADGSVSFRRVGLSQSAQLRVVVARPETVDAFCGRAGLRTGGRVSCWDGYRAMLNLDRWNTGVAPFHSDLAVYRQYLVNHEVGHGLGHGHQFCTQTGALAPVMMQQTGGIGSCLANGWPFPS